MVEIKVGGVGNAGLTRSVDATFLNGGDESLFEAVAEHGNAVFGAVGEAGEGDFRSFAEADDAGDVLSAGAALALVRSAEDERLKTRAAAGVEHSNALGRVEFVAGEAEQMAADGLDVDGDFAGGLNRVRVETNSGFGGDFADLLDGLDDARFVVGHHDADEFGVRLERAVDVEGVNDSEGRNGEDGDVDAALAGLLRGVQDGGVLDGGDDEVVAGTQDAEEGGVVALGAAGGEDDFGGAAVEERGDLLAGALDGGAGVLAVLMDGGGVAEGVDKEGPHGVQHLGEQRGGGVGVHVDAAHRFILAGVGGRRATEDSLDSSAEIQAKLRAGSDSPTPSTRCGRWGPRFRLTRSSPRNAVYAKVNNGLRNMRALVVEDEARVAENIAAALRESAGLAVDVARSGPEGVEFGEQSNYDLIVLDLMLPGLGGAGVLKAIRARGQTAPVLVLTAVAEKASVVSLLNAGADDYLAKPFDLGELLARAKALIRRGKGVSHPKIQVAELTIDTIEKTVTLAGRPVELSPTEYRALEYLSHRPRAVVSKQVLLEHLYDYNWEHHSNVIEAHISNLRRKLNRGGAGSDGGPWIETLRGRGYRLIAATRSGNP